MVTGESYKYKLATKMADKFVKEVKEKTGLKAAVMMDHMNMSIDETRFLTRLITLGMLEEEFLKAYPLTFKTNPLRLKNRKIEYVEARCIFCYIAKEKLKFTYTGIGRYLEKDHTSIIHMNKRARNLLETDDKFMILYNQTIENIKMIYDKTPEYSN